MSILQAINEVKKLTEADIFKGASDKELNKRRSEYADIQKKEDERRRKAREEEIAAMGMSPIYHKIVELVPVVQELVDEYQDDQAEWIGNYSHFVDGSPVKLSFNIKMGGTDIPDWAREKIDKMGLDGASDDYYWSYLADRLTFFADGLREEYGFIEDWFQEGRSGGWLVLKVDNIVNDDILTVLEVFHAPMEIDNREEYGFPDWFSAEGLRDAEYILQNAKKVLTQRIHDYQAITIKVDRAKSSVEEDLESDDFWNGFFEAYEEPAEKAK